MTTEPCEECGACHHGSATGNDRRSKPARRARVYQGAPPCKRNTSGRTALQEKRRTFPSQAGRCVAKWQQRTRNIEDRPEPEQRTAKRRAAGQRKQPRSVDFEHLFQGGHAEYKHKIVEEDGQWFILRCDEHDLHFGDRPVVAAVCHLRSNAHGGLPQDASSALRTLGIRVLRCDAAKAAENNRVFSAAVSGGYQIRKGKPAEDAERLLPPELRTGYGPSGPPHGDPSPAPPVRQETRPFEGITDPVPGELYLGYWSGTSAGWYAVVVLPHDDLKSVGISGSLSDTQLITGHIPACYRYDKKTRIIAGWAKGYQDGGPSVLKRKFPVMYFDDQTIPAEGTLPASSGSLAWLLAKHLQPFSKQGPRGETVRGYDVARSFSERRKSAGSIEPLHRDASASAGNTTGALLDHHCNHLAPILTV